MAIWVRRRHRNELSVRETALRYFGNRPANTSPIQISSSSASQRNALPPTRKPTWLSNSGDAAASRGNFEAGKPIVRSSASSTQTRRSSIQHRTACGTSISTSAAAMESTVSVDQEIAILLNQPPNTVHLVWRKAVVEGNRDWTQPKFHFEIAARDMNVRRLIRLAAIEVETLRPDSKDGGHYTIVSLLFIASKAKRPLFQHGRRNRGNGCAFAPMFG